MDDDRIWAMEESLWTGDADVYHALIDDACVMVVPAPPFVMQGAAAIDAVSHTPRWSTVRFSEQNIVRPQDGLIVIGYHVEAMRGGSDPYVAWCTTTMRRLGPDTWRVVQHQQTPPPVA